MPIINFAIYVEDPRYENDNKDQSKLLDLVESFEIERKDLNNVIRNYINSNPNDLFLQLQFTPEIDCRQLKVSPHFDVESSGDF